MQHRTGARILGVLIAIVIVAALGVSLLIRGDTAKLPEAAATGASPALPEPNKRLIPTVHIAPAKGWPEGRKPRPAAAERLQGGVRAVRRRTSDERPPIF
jgi:hypothetical protein